MSVASEFPPEVLIPERARRTMSGASRRVRHLTLVSQAGGVLERQRPGISTTGRTATVRPLGVRPRPAAAHGGGFAESRVDWPLTVQPSARPLRLTRRGLVVAVLLTVLVAASLLLVARLSAGSAPSTPALPAGSTITVQPGDTLWSIAQRAEPHSDPRLVVDQLRKANHLNSVVLSPGQTLKVG